MLNTTIRGGKISASPKKALAGTPVHKQILDYIDKARMTQLMPDRRGTVVQQSTDKTKLQIQGVGESAADGHDYAVILPYVSAQMLDSQGQPFPGGPSAGDDVFVRDLSRGNPVILGQRVSSPQPSPFVSGVVPGNGIASTAYADSNVLNPTISVKTKTASPAGTAGGLHVDSTGLGISLASGSPLVVGSGLDVSLVTGTPLTKSSSGLDIGLVSGAPLTKSSSGLNVAVDNSTIKVSGSQLVGGYVAGSNVTITGNSIAATNTTYTAGTGISIVGSTISVSLTAGTGISISGATITNAHTAGTGISIVSNAIAVSLTGGNGISISGATITAKLGAALSFDGSGNIQVNPNGSGALSTTVGLAVKVDGTTIGINASNQLTALGGGPTFGSVGAASVADASGHTYVSASTPLADEWQSNGYLPITIGGSTYYLPLFSFHG